MFKIVALAQTKGGFRKDGKPKKTFLAKANSLGIYDSRYQTIGGGTKAAKTNKR